MFASCCLQTALAGFNSTEPFKLCYPEIMHQTDLGDGLRLITDLTKHLKRQAVREVINPYLSEQSYPGLRLPNGGMGANMVPGFQQAALLKCLPSALLCIDTDMALRFSRLIIGTSSSSCITLVTCASGPLLVGKNEST